MNTERIFVADSMTGLPREAELLEERDGRAKVRYRGTGAVRWIDPARITRLPNCPHCGYPGFGWACSVTKDNPLCLMCGRNEEGEFVVDDFVSVKLPAVVYAAEGMGNGEALRALDATGGDDGAA